jgi:hypothetical protein
MPPVWQPHAILCAVNPEAIRKILDRLGLPSRPPPIFPVLQENYFI